MHDIVISVEDIGKVYRLGQIGSGTLSHDLNRWWAQMRGKEDPLTKIEDSVQQNKKGNKDYVWALKNVSFNLQKGDVLGIVGSNGAGKSTLLKILSEITSPTVGRIKLKGNVASLLEVGTGFHPELTGRENIYLNGAILGMKRKEIKAKFDEIVSFAGVEKFIDTPVKRYSSGMYVRLAFAVAAHLEPDILIIDEVLAVGDAEFQKRCLGKMKDVSRNEGRTILFVSHNMQAVNSLCNRAMWMQNGMVKEIGETTSIINSYISGAQQLLLQQRWDEPGNAPGTDWIKFRKVELIPQLSDPNAPIDIRVPLTVKFQLTCLEDNITVSVGLHLFSLSGECIFDVPSPTVECNVGLVEGECTIPGNFLNDGSYYISLIVIKNSSSTIYYLENCLAFDVEDYRGDLQYFEKWVGAVRPKLPFKLKTLATIL